MKALAIAAFVGVAYTSEDSELFRINPIVLNPISFNRTNITFPIKPQVLPSPLLKPQLPIVSNHTNVTKLPLYNPYQPHFRGPVAFEDNEFFNPIKSLSFLLHKKNATNQTKKPVMPLQNQTNATNSTSFNRTVVPKPSFPNSRYLFAEDDEFFHPMKSLATYWRKKNATANDTKPSLRANKSKKANLTNDTKTLSQKNIPASQNKTGFVMADDDEFIVNDTTINQYEEVDIEDLFLKGRSPVLRYGQQVPPKPVVRGKF